LGDNWKSFFRSNKDYKKRPDKYKSKPKPPRYKKEVSAFYIGRNGFSIKDSKVFLAKRIGVLPFKITCCSNQPINSKQGASTVVQDIRFIPTGNAFFIEIVYKSKRPAYDALDPSHVLGIDLGINNLAAMASNQPDFTPVLINGRVLKSINAQYNKDSAKIRAKGKGNHLKSKSVKRFCRVNDYLHKASFYIVQKALEARAGALVIGHNKGWKQSVNIGKVNNQKFVSIPHSKLIEKIRYKAEQYGIRVIVR